MLFSQTDRGGGGGGGGSGFGDGGSTNRGRRKGKWKESIDSGGVKGGSGSGSPSWSANGPNQNGPKFKQAQTQNKKPNSNYDPNRKPKTNRSKTICYRCDKPGHLAYKCPDRLKKFQESNFTEEDDADETVFFHETVFLNEEKVIPSRYNSQENDVWYLDNGASNHMTGNRSFFSELDENITGRVKFGDNSCVVIKGKGSILLQ